MNDKDLARAELIRRALERYERPLVRYAQRITGDLDRARDVVQETFLKLWQGRAPDEAALATWLFTVCRNAALSVRRKEKRMSHLETNADFSPGESPGPAAAVQQQEDLGRASAAMATLPARQQEILRLKFQEGFSYKQIAEITSLSASNVGFLIHTGIKRIQEIMQA
ncbi:MAG: sigma-70 family RNA polymerase sigma factor [Planctomycetaceae bacterium]|nr:sigma-70 family RNA polymerase sigma factor [Planctomycetaceae bacterium]